MTHARGGVKCHASVHCTVLGSCAVARIQSEGHAAFEAPDRHRRRGKRVAVLQAKWRPYSARSRTRPPRSSARTCRASTIAAQPAQDIYSLGVMVFEALTHARALPAFGASSAAVAAATGAQQYPWELADDKLSPAFGRSKIRGMLAACLAREASARPTAARLCEQLIGIGDATLASADAEAAGYFVTPPAAV